MYGCELPQFLGHFGVMGKVFMPGKRNPEELITRVSELATIARKDGMMALEGQEVPDKFFEKGLQMLVDGADEAKLNEQMQLELAAMKKRHEMNQAVIGSWIDIGPAMGMIGTLVGLVAMLGLSSQVHFRTASLSKAFCGRGGSQAGVRGGGGVRGAPAAVSGG